MILVTGGTGFIGQALIRHLVEDGQTVRTLIRPTSRNPALPRGVPIEAAISAINDARGLRAAVTGVQAVYHLVGAERQGTSVDLGEVEIEGTRTLVEVCKDAGVERLFYLSHLGAELNSGYALLKAKGIAEEIIRSSDLDFTILRSGLVFGPRDQFTTALARMISFFPFVFPVPGDGNSLIQPLWVEDLVTMLAWSLENDNTRNQVYEVGGPEHISVNVLINTVMEAMDTKRRLVYVRPSYLRILGVILEYFFPRLPFSVYWLDYLAANRTSELDTVPRVFGLMPARLTNHLAHLAARRQRRDIYHVT